MLWGGLELIIQKVYSVLGFQILNEDLAVSVGRWNQMEI